MLPATPSEQLQAKRKVAFLAIEQLLLFELYVHFAVVVLNQVTNFKCTDDLTPGLVGPEDRGQAHASRCLKGLAEIVQTVTRHQLQDFIFRTSLQGFR